jgi:hypothetical protein
MKFRTQLLWTLNIQGLGALSMLAATLVIGVYQSPSQQGLFSIIKTELQFISALCLFGLPQAIFYFSESNRLQRKIIFQLVAGVAIFTLIVGLLYIALTRSEDVIYAIVFALAASISSLYGVMRVLVLADSSVRLFNIVTATPQIIVFLLVSALVFFISELTALQIIFIFLASVVAGTFIALIAIKGKKPISHFDSLVTSRELISYSAAAWFNAILLGASSLLWLRYIEASLGLAAVGPFTMGLMLINFILTPLNFALPLLFKRWIKSPVSNKNLRSTLASGFWAFLAVVLVLIVTDFCPPLPFLNAYSDLERFKWFFGAIAVAEVVIRIAGVSANSIGQPWISVVGEIARALTLIVFFLYGGFLTLFQFILAWMVGAIMSSVIILYQLYRNSIVKTHKDNLC